MLDIRYIRKNADEVKEKLSKRDPGLADIVDEVISVDALRREAAVKAESMKAEQNKVSKEIPRIKKGGGNIDDIMTKMKELSAEIKQWEKRVADFDSHQRDLLLELPNLPHESVPIGQSDEDNIEVRRSGEPTKFNFEPKAHWDLGAALGILDPEAAAKVTGSRFHFYKGLGARLERAVINFFLNTHTEHGYTEVLPPFIVNRDSMTGTGQLPKFEEDAFKLANTEYFLIPTAEVPVTNLYRNQILTGADLPIKYCAYSACFRSEAGSAGRDQRGLIRQHQFNKVELVKFARPENSYEELEQLTNDAERLLVLLGLPFRVVNLCGGDLGFSSAKTYDIEVYMPSYDRYVEISSCSNFEDYQARRAKIRFKDNIKDKAEFVHTLNGSGLAVGRTVAAILENYQNEDGSIRIPDVLIPYMGCDIIE